MKNIMIDYFIPMGSGMLIGHFGYKFAQWAMDTPQPSLWIVLPSIFVLGIGVGGFLYPPIARWLRG